MEIRKVDGESGEREKCREYRWWTSRSKETVKKEAVKCVEERQRRENEQKGKQ